MRQVNTIIPGAYENGVSGMPNRSAYQRYAGPMAWIYSIWLFAV